MFNLDFIIVVLYLLSTFFIGIYKGKEVKSFSEYAIGDYKFSSFTLIATITATWIAAGSIIGSHEKVYEGGVVWIIIFSGEIIAIYIFSLLAPKLIRFKGALSVGEILGIWYGKEARIIGGICVALRNTGTIAAQIGAMGYLFNEFFSVQPFIGIIISAGIVVIYSSFGGIKAVTYTDVIQFVFFIVAIPLISIVMYNKIGGFKGIISNVPAEHLKLFPNYGTVTEYIFLFIFFAVPFWDASLIQRVLMAKDENQIRVSFKTTAFLILIFYLACGFIALAALSLNKEINPNSVLYFVINNYLPVGIKGIGIVALIAIVMSSADSYLNVSSVSIIHDIVNPLRKEPLSNNQELKIIKITTLIIGVSAIIVAINFKSIVSILIKAWIVWAPIVAVPLYAAILGIKSNIKTFIYSSLAGLVLVILWLFLDLEKVTGIESIIPGVLANLAVFFIFTKYYNKISNNVESKIS